MNRKYSQTCLLIVVAILASVAVEAITTVTSAAQDDPSITATGVIGEVKALDAAAQKLTVKTDAGAVVSVLLSDKTVYRRLAPGETTLTNAAAITLPDVGAGDRVWARGKVSDDRKSLPATTMLIVMSRVDIAKKQEAERLEWRRRGILGVVTALKPETKEITISSRSMAGLQPVVITGGSDAEFLRYAPDSIKFSDAKVSSFEELKLGDQLRALGQRTADGTHFTADKVVSGAFRTAAGSVTSVDAATGEIHVNDLETKKPLTIVVRQDSVLRKFPAMSEMGAMMGFGRGPGAAGQRPAANQGQPPGQAGGQREGMGGAPAPTGPGGRPGGGFNMQDILDRLPIISVGEVTVGDTIIVSCTHGVDPSRLTAITVVTGADTLLSMLAATQQTQRGGQAVPNPAAGLGSGITFGIGLP